ncbi:nucleotidyltransferase [Ectothiorhodospiraceae bacterium BW-2]|nr:nucleotidyltransferase [Ectothiorhodospiraceae bacterium BW-2]
MTQLYDILQQHKSEIVTIAEQCHAVNVRLFGSVVRGEESAYSDIDLLVDFLPGSTLIDQINLTERLTTILERKVDVVSSRSLNKYLRQQILGDAQQL